MLHCTCSICLDYSCKQSALLQARKEGNKEVCTKLEQVLKIAMEEKQKTLRPEIQLLNNLMAATTVPERERVCFHCTPLLADCALIPLLIASPLHRHCLHCGTLPFYTPCTMHVMLLHSVHNAIICYVHWWPHWNGHQLLCTGLG